MRKASPAEHAPHNDILREMKDVMTSLLQATDESLAAAKATNAAAHSLPVRGLTEDEKLLVAIRRFVGPLNLADPESQVKILRRITYHTAKMMGNSVGDYVHTFEK